LAWLLNDGFVDQVGSWGWESLDDLADFTWGTWNLGDFLEDLWGSVWSWLAAGNRSSGSWGDSNSGDWGSSDDGLGAWGIDDDSSIAHFSF
jgi:hypothetical protein